nr:hypothetical protein [Tanacetum cinerariifolium]
LDRNNETIAKYLQEYQQFAAELPLERIIELISDLVKYQENYAKIYMFQSQQRKSWTKNQKRDYYMALIRNNLGWKVKDFKGMTFEEVEAKFNSVYKQMEDFIPMEEVIEEAKSNDEIPEEKIKEMMQLIPIEEVYVEDLQVKHLIIDWKVHKKGQRSYWKIIRSILASDQPQATKRWSSRVHQVTAKDKEIFILVEKVYPLRKGLALVMICYKLQLENFSHMANDLVLKIYKIANSLRQQEDDEDEEDDEMDVEADEEEEEEEHPALADSVVVA